MHSNQLNRSGLYIHIPFCTRLCHYCDFVKTARFEANAPSEYLASLNRYAAAWLAAWGQHSGSEFCLDSLFFGGGTPSLIDSDYRSLLDHIRRWLKPHAEVTLEVNPEHVTEAKLNIWSNLGFNRLSLGVQSFQEQGLKFLTREHSAAQAQLAIDLALRVVPNLNIDLIYGWDGQDLDAWQKDLELALQTGVQHLSLYTLTYEGQTPLARKHRRGVLHALPDDLLEDMYQLACRLLAEAGFVHEEVSNWHKPGFASVHNSIYWQGESYIGLGPGAHSFLADCGGSWGTRWSQEAKMRSFQGGLNLLTPGANLSRLLELPGILIETDRAAPAWLLEVLGTGLRTARGINLNAIARKTGYTFQPRPAIASALERGLMQMTTEGVLTLKPEEWYRETGWALEAARSFS